jgi:hypothetical protein
MWLDGCTLIGHGGRDGRLPRLTVCENIPIFVQMQVECRRAGQLHNAGPVPERTKRTVMRGRMPAPSQMPDGYAERKKEIQFNRIRQ